MLPPFDKMAFCNLEVIGACNLKCGHCPRDDTARDQGAMSMDLYKKLLVQVPKTTEVRLFLSGEPFLDKHLADRVKLATASGHKTLIHSNATKVTPIKALEVIEQGPTTISVSIDGATPAAYEFMRPPGKFEDARNGVTALLDARDYLASSTRIVLQTIVPYPTPLNSNSGMTDLVDRFDKVYVRHPHNWASDGSVEGAAPSNYSAQTCYFLDISMSIQSNGMVVPCCACLNEEHVMGDANTTSLRDIWAAEFQRFRTFQRDRKPLPVCSDCERYNVKPTKLPVT